MLGGSFQRIEYHSALMRNLIKVWKTWLGLLQGGRAWSRGPKSALSEILQNKEYYHKFSKTEFQKFVSKLLESEKVKPL